MDRNAVTDSPEPRQPVVSLVRPVEPFHFAPVPRARTPLVGRENEIGLILALLRERAAPLVTLTGPGGVGKTRLALEIAARSAHQFRDGECFVDFSPLVDPELVLPTLAHAVGLSDKGNRPLHEQLVHYLGPYEVLLVLDNLERVVDAGVFLAELANGCPKLRILATSRVVLRLSLEQDVPIEPLPDDAAVDLFLQRARAKNQEITLTPENTEIISAICARLDGLPLAIELAAARLPVLTPPALLRRLDHALPILTGGDRDRPDRLRTMRDAIGWSYDLLSPEEQVAFRRLAIFAGGFGLEAAEALCLLSVAGIETEDGGARRRFDSSLDLVVALVEKSLVRQTGAATATEPRYQMLETLREFGFEKLTEAAEFDAAERARAEFYAGFADQAEPQLTGLDQVTWFERLETEHANFRAALTWAVVRDGNLGLRIAAALNRFWDHHSHVREGLAWLERTLANESAGTDALRAKAFWGAGVLAIGLGDYDRAERDLTQSLTLARRATDPYYAGFALNGLGTVAIHHGDLALAETCYAEGLTLLREARDDDGIAALLGNLGYLALVRGDDATAVGRSEESLEKYRDLKSVHGTASMSGTLGRALIGLGNIDGATTALVEALNLSQALGNKWYATAALEGLAGVAAAKGENVRAVKLFAAIETFVEANGIALHPYDRATNQRFLAAAKATLDEAVFVQTWETGRGMSFENVVAEAFNIETSTAANDNQPELSGFELLTHREIEVLRILVEGKSDREIAEELFVSPRTVNFHMTNLLRKLNLDSRTAAAAYAVRHGLA